MAVDRPDRSRPTFSDLKRLGRLYAFLKPYRGRLQIALVAVAVSSGLGLVFPRVMGTLVDTALRASTADRGTLNRVALLLVGVFLVQAVFNYVQTYLLALVGEGVVADVRSTLYEHLLFLPVKFFDSRRTGEITSRLTSDVAVVQGAVSQSVASALGQAITLVGGVVLLVVLSPQLSLVVLAVLPIVIGAAAFFGRRLQRISTEFQDRVADATASAEEAIGAVRVVQWFTAERAQIARYVGHVGESYKVALRRARWRALFGPSISFLMLANMAFVLWYGGRRVLAGAMMGGDLISFLLYTFIVAGAIGTFAGLYGQVQEAVGASRRIFDLLDERSDIVDPADPIEMGRVTGRVALENLSFRYPDREVDVLAGVTLEARPGEVVALVGPSGAGKSTLVQLLPRFYDATDGAVLVDGVDVRRMRVHELRSHMAAVPQETQLFAGTIAENIRVGKPEATDAEVHAAAAAANAAGFILAFPDGYDTVVGERGVKLSGGQRQRVAIARALLNDPRILILDEATSSLDSEAEAVVQQALEVLMEGRTTFVIAHRLSTVRSADHIVVLEGGRVVQEGTHDRLIAEGGLYQVLYERQFRDEAEPVGLDG